MFSQFSIVKASDLLHSARASTRSTKITTFQNLKNIVYIEYLWGKNIPNLGAGQLLKTINQVHAIHAPWKHCTHHACVIIWHSYIDIIACINLLRCNALSSFKYTSCCRCCAQQLQTAIKGALYRIYQVIILCRRFPAKFSDIVSPARDSHA